jgi:hypothetical protein
MTVPSIWLRRIHKWVGLVIGLQFLIWAISGTAMALLDMNEVAGGEAVEQRMPAIPAAGHAWPKVQRSIGNQQIRSITMRPLQDRQVLEVVTSAGVRLFDAGSGAPVEVDRALAASLATAAHPSSMRPSNVTKLSELTLAVREHELPIWQVDFADDKHSSFYISGTTGQILERRNDTWRWWDFFWMLHNMDYAKRTSFNHPLIVMVGFAMAWLAVTGFWLLFRTMWRHDMAFLTRRGSTTSLREQPHV